MTRSHPIRRNRAEMSMEDIDDAECRPRRDLVVQGPGLPPRAHQAVVQQAQHLNPMRVDQRPRKLGGGAGVRFHRLKNRKPVVLDLR